MDGRIPLILDGGACEVGLESTVSVTAMTGLGAEGVGTHRTAELHERLAHDVDAGSANLVRLSCVCIAQLLRRHGINAKSRRYATPVLGACAEKPGTTSLHQVVVEKDRLRSGPYEVSHVLRYGLTVCDVGGAHRRHLAFCRQEGLKAREASEEIRVDHAAIAERRRPYGNRKTCTFKERDFVRKLLERFRPRRPVEIEIAKLKLHGVSARQPGISGKFGTSKLLAVNPVELDHERTFRKRP